MKTKPLTIKLRHTVSGEAIGPARHDWQVSQVTDSILYHPGQYLTREQVTELCANEQWKVTIVSAHD